MNAPLLNSIFQAMKSSACLALAVALVAQTAVAESVKNCQPFSLNRVGCVNDIGGCQQRDCDDQIWRLQCTCPDDYPHVKCGFKCPPNSNGAF